jgi:transporter family-2 protein
MTLILLLLAFVVGASLSVQVGLNAQLRQVVGDPMLAALGSFLVGTTALLVVVMAMRVSWPAPADLRGVPVSYFLGGLLGAVYVASAVVLAPKLGSATLLALIVSGQLLMSVLLDHFGWLGFAEHPVNLWRLVGIALLILGVVLVVRN